MLKRKTPTSIENDLPKLAFFKNIGLTISGRYYDVAVASVPLSNAASNLPFTV
jgi:hypothetical protein